LLYGAKVIGLEAVPAVRAQLLERPIAGLVGHPLRILDPIAEIDVGQARSRRPDDVIENDVRTEAGPGRVLRLEEAVDHRQPVSLLIGETGADKPARFPVRRRLPVFKHKA